MNPGNCERGGFSNFTLINAGFSTFCSNKKWTVTDETENLALAELSDVYISGILLSLFRVTVNICSPARWPVFSHIEIVSL